MFVDTILAKIFGTKDEREIKRVRPIISAINDLEPQVQALSDAELAGKTAEFKLKLDQGATLDDLLIDAFAVGREAGRRVLNMRHFDVQLMGGIMLHRGKIAEMRTGEGKTLVATLPVYLNALSGVGVHVVTVNDYLARRDAEWMGRLYRFLSLTTGIIVHGLDDQERQASYRADITYGTNNEYGFDYLRDNMKFRLQDCVQRGHNFAIIDEVDSILIDEARTPLIISGPSEESTDKYYKINRIIPRLIRGEVIEGKEPGEKYTTGDYTVDEKHRSVALTEEGVLKCEKLLGIGNMYDPENIETNHHVQQGLRAHVLYHRDKDYLVKDGEVIIVDEFTGRLMPGRRWSDGLHQAVEAKEGVKIERENQTLATISFQNYFRMYKKLGGMTGTAETEAAEFAKTYNVDVIGTPTHRDMIRKDAIDTVYRTEPEKFRNAAKEIQERHATGQPVLVGTVSVEKSEQLSAVLKKMGVKHEVLNAKNHEREAFIVSQAGRKGAVTVSTNMAGRGTDILLGGNAEYLAKDAVRRDGRDPDHLDPSEWKSIFAKYKAQCDAEHEEVVKAGGLHIVGTERHESRRIDNQLRGRAGRQGDPGSSRFYLSLQDDLMRIFGGERITNLMLKLGMEEDVPIESKLITRRIAAAQKAVEAQNYAARKHLLEYDDVMNKQRKAIYALRRSLLEGGDMREVILGYVKGIVGSLLDLRCPPEAKRHDWDFPSLQSDVLTQFGVKITPEAYAGLSRPEMEERLVESLERRYKEKEDLLSPEVMRETERIIMLNVIDQQWKDHLLSMDHLREGIGLRGYGQKDPLIEYKKESFKLYEAMRDRVEDETVRYLYFLQSVEQVPDLTEDPGFDEIDPSLGLSPDPNLGLPAYGGEHGGGNGNGSKAPAAPPPPSDFSDEQRQAAQHSVEEFTKKIERKKQKELDAIQVVGPTAANPTQQNFNKFKNVGRNDLCPCGSGKKYKKCHGA
ncbi:MAG: preprotein translocase subunit SecA [Acidobacteria bacterium]|nr:preprotein translocase subunit SecA [Acidobacteriota bacterium]